jgi:DNA-directed RNA polymerase subunit RPC12/RpoP
MVAGVDKDARALVEAAVRRAFQPRPVQEAWSVSLVRLASQWSVTLSGPGERFRHVSFVAEATALEEQLRAAISEGQPGSAAAAAGAGPATARSRVEERHVCEKCRKELQVSYEGVADEPKERAPVACPHCWQVIHVPIGSWAVAGGEYAAVKL